MEYPAAKMYLCDKCQGILDVVYEYGSDYSEMVGGGGITKKPEYVLPLKEGSYISIGQGNTPLIRSSRLGSKYGLKHLYLKCEFLNPTGSFKDRPVSVGVSKALEFGCDKVVVASSGNGAAAVAAFCAKAGIRAVVLVPESTPKEKVFQAAYYGAKIIKVKGPYSNSFALARQLSERLGLFNLTTTFLNPYTVEGDKLVGYELYDQLSKKVPDAVIVPIGAGPLLVGIYKSFKELFSGGLVDRIPRFIGVQAEGCSPMAEAFRENQETVLAEEAPHTIAGGICDGLVGYTQDGEYTLKVIRDSSGLCVACDDTEISEAQSELAKTEGLFVEPSSAAAFAAVKKLTRDGKIPSDWTIAAILTGFGLKDMNSIKTNSDIEAIETIEQAEKVLNS